MKHHFPLILVTLAAALGPTTGCSGRTEEPTPAVTPAATPDPFAAISAALDKVTRDQTSTLAAPQAAMNRAIDAQIAAWKAAGGTSTTADEAKLALARTDFAQKVTALGFADDTTWSSARSVALVSLQSLHRAYRELLNGPAKG